MADPRLIRTADLDPGEIDVGKRLRPVSQPGVAALVASVRDLGVMLDAVHVRQIRAGGKTVLRLMAGGHRVAACEALGRAVPAKIWECTDDFARMLELDDNLASAELCPLDMAIFLAERQALYQKLNPGSKKGISGALARWDRTDIVSVSYAKAVASNFGVSDRHIRRLAQAGAALTDEDRITLQGAGQVLQKDLLALAKADPPLRRAAIDRFAAGEAASLVAALRQVAPASEVPAKDTAEEALAELQGRWSRLPVEVRRRFVEANAGELAGLLAGRQTGDDRDA